MIYFVAAAISNPWSNFTLYRNPKFRNSGKLMSFSDFLALAKYSPSVSGVLISIEVSLCVLFQILIA